MFVLSLLHTHRILPKIDYFGIADIIHQLLFSKPLDITRTETGEFAQAEALRRYWQAPLWARLFSSLLNANSDDGTLAPATLTALRTSFERHLLENPLKSKSLNAALMKQEMRLCEFRGDE